MRRVPGPFEHDLGARRLAERGLEPRDRLCGMAVRSSRVIVRAWRGRPDQERQLNIQIDEKHLAGVYANFANISFSDYEFTLTFARIDHEVEEGDIPGIVVARVNMSTKFAKELLDAMQDSWSKYATVRGIQDLPKPRPREFVARGLARRGHLGRPREPARARGGAGGDRRGRFDEIWCLGDVVGYGPRPNECTALVRERAALCLAGNHDLVVLGKIR